MTAKKCTKKRDARAKLLFCLVKLLLFLLSRRRCILNFLLFTTHCDPSETEFSRCKLLLLVASETFFDSSVVPSFWLGKLGERTGQLWRDNRELKQRRRRRQRERQKSNRFRLAKKQQLCTCFKLFCTFLCSRCTTTTRKCLNSRFVEDGNTRQQLPFSFPERL